MSYVAIYRKWRPRQFEDVVGQEHIITTLKNQIMYNRIAHAYLFSGTRGTGKTSTAKIFARAVNCPDHIKGNPCGVCPVCSEIEDAGVMDIVEIDAASNRGVDEIRDLREKVKYPPTLGKYKVYIIDEVHMLTQEAFNALLKTLEEPPKHVIFILATTEPHKIPATILSRCQGFDFKRVRPEDMVKRMDYICTEMNISIEKEALELVAQNAEGALRDALSILDQCLSLVDEGETITYESVIDTLGLASSGWLFQISQSILDQNIEDSIKLLHQIINEGKDVMHIAKQLTQQFRNILMAKTLPNLQDILEIPQDQIEKLQKQGQGIQEEKLFRFINECSEIENTMKYTTQPTITLEMTLIKLCKEPRGEALENIIERLKNLEEKIAQGRIMSSTTSTKEGKGSPRDRINKPIPEKQHSKGSQEKPQENPKEDMVQKPLKTNGSLTLEDIQSKWEEILKIVKKRKITVAALLKEGRPAQLKDHKLLIAFGDGFGFHQAALTKKESIELLETTISEVVGSAIKVGCVMEDQIFSVQDEKPEIDPIKAAQEIFGKDLVEIEDEH